MIDHVQKAEKREQKRDQKRGLNKREINCDGTSFFFLIVGKLKNNKVEKRR